MKAKGGAYASWKLLRLVPLLLAMPAWAADPLTLESCIPVKGKPAARCGKLSVPENWSKFEGRRIDLKIVVVPATGAVKLPPLYDFPGGPGIAETSSVDFWLTDGAVHHRDRDVVLIDQRGTGGSRALNCALPFSDPFHEMFPHDAVRRCRKELGTSADFAQYSTDAAVRDVEAVRTALGHDTIDISGLSYGTRYAMAYAQAYPQRVRAMALIGTVPPDMRLPQEFAADAQRVVDRLLGECAFDANCGRAFPDLTNDWKQLSARLSTTPVRFDGRELNPGAFWESFRSQLVTTDKQRQIPWLIHTLAGHTPGPALARLRSDDPPFFASGLLLSVECPEDTLHLSASERASNGTGTFLGNYRVQRQYAACKDWSVAPRDSAYRTPAAVKTPTLFIVGDMDYVTPPSATERARRAFPNSRVVRIDHLGHFPSGLAHIECIDEMIAAFFAASGVEDLDTSCVSQMSPPPFYSANEAPPH
jgi:pimeloyl-ACP methyl ester carboxylesterase